VKSHPPLPLTRAEVVKRALYAAAQLPVVGYELGEGGRFPAESTPATPNAKGEPRSDCVGFVCWAWGIDRWDPAFPVYGGWRNTDSLIEDAKTSRHTVVEIRPEELLPGDALVFGSKRSKLPPFGRIPGHICVAVEAWRGWAATTVVDCSGGKAHRAGRAINRRTAAIWEARGVAIRLVRFAAPAVAA
jgi:hypothetical protein